MESADISSAGGRYSIIGLNSNETINFKDDMIIHRSENKVKKINTTDPLKWLSTFWNNFKKEIAIPKDFSHHRFCGGLAGMISWDFALYLQEGALKDKPTLCNIPMISFIVCREFAIFDTWRQTLSLGLIVENNRNGLTQAKKRLEKIVKSLTKKAQKAIVSTNLPLSKPNHLVSHTSAQTYRKQVRTIKNMIANGEALQVVLSYCQSIPYQGDTIKLYRMLRLINPAPYLNYFHFSGFHLIGSSPELLISLNANRTTSLRPFAGTRHRGKTKAEDQMLENELLSDEKEKAEHTMLIDLGRNDLSQVCKTGSIKLTKIMEVEKLAKVMHLSSTIEGTLNKNKDEFDLFRSVFPAGTLSGAPKVKAMQIIDKFEPYRRGSYGGAVGYLSLNGTMDLAITIRTMIYQNKTIYLQSGAGIVYDSDANKEYKECQNKSRALWLAISGAMN